MTPTISILTPMKNAEDWVGATIASVQAQTRTDWEMIIVDDGSTDASVTIARTAAAQDHRIQVVDNQGANGAAGARNTALAHAKGHYIAFLDSDDLWDPTKIADQIGAMKAENWVFSWTSYRVESDAHRADATLSMPIRHAKPTATRHDLLSKKAPIGCLTAVYDTEAFGKVPMNANLPTQEDFALWAALMLRVEQEGWAAGGLTEPLATYRLRGGSLSANKAKVALRHWNVLTQHCGQTPIQAASLFAQYAVRGVMDRLRLRVQPSAKTP